MTDDISFKAAWRGFHMMISHKRAVRSRFQNGGLKGSMAPGLLRKSRKVRF